MERVEAHQFRQLQEIGHAAGMFERLVELLVAAEHVHVLPVFLAQLANLVPMAAARPLALRDMPQ